MKNLNTKSQVVTIAKEDEAIIKQARDPRKAHDRLLEKHPDKNMMELFIEALNQNEKTADLGAGIKKIKDIELSDIFALICNKNSNFKDSAEALITNLEFLESTAELGNEIVTSPQNTLAQTIEVKRKAEEHGEKTNISLMLMKYHKIADYFAGQNPYSWIENILNNAPTIYNEKDNIQTTEIAIKKENFFTDFKEKIKNSKILISKKKTIELENAVYFGDYEKCEKLLKSMRVDVNHCNDEGHTILMQACKEGNTKIVKLLLRHGAKMEMQTFTGETALIYTAKYEHIETMIALLEYGANPNTLNNANSSALIEAALFKNPKGIPVLLEYNADANIQNVWGKNALMLACRGDILEAVKLLLPKTKNINAQDEEGKTALLHAIYGGNENIVKLLLDDGADVLIKCEKGKSALDYAKQWYDPINPAIYNLIYKATELQKNTIKLLEAIEKNDIKSAKKIIKNGVCFKYKNKSGKTVQEIAIEWERTEIAGLIANTIKKENLKSALIVNIENNEKIKIANYELIEGVKNDDIDKVKSAIKKGANINIQDEEGNTPISIACKNANKKIAQLLLLNDADVSIKNNDGHTPLMRAKFWAGDDFANIIINHIEQKNNSLSREELLMNIAYNCQELGR